MYSQWSQQTSIGSPFSKGRSRFCVALAWEIRILNLDNRIPWARLGYEGALIVVSILAAFSIESWWSARQLVEEEQKTLAQLELEFETNTVLLAGRRKRLERIKEAAEILLRLTGPDYDDKNVDIEVVNRSIHALKFWATFDPQMGVLSSLTQSGKLGMIRSDRLRNALAAWPAVVQDTAENEIHLGKFTTESLTPYLTEKSSARNLSVIPHIGASQFSVNEENVLTDRVFENLVYDKLVFITDVLKEYDDVSASINDILQLIDSEIDAK